MTTGKAARILSRCRVWSCPPRGRGGGLGPSQLSSPAAPAVSSASGARRARRASSPPVVLVAGRRVVLLRLMPVRRKPVAWVRCRRSTPRSVRPTRALGALSERDGRTLPLPLPCSPCCSRAAWRAVRPPVDKVPQGTKGHGASGAPHGPRSACVGARPYAGARRTVQTNRTNIPYHTAPVPDPGASSPSLVGWSWYRNVAVRYMFAPEYTKTNLSDP